MASSSSTNPAYDVLSFNGCDRLIALHQEITNFLHYQSHVRSGTPRPSPYRCTPPPSTTENEKRLLSFSKKSTPISRCSDGSSKWPTTMQLNCTASLRTCLSTQTSTGESSTGAQCHNGKNRCCHHRNDALATPSASHSNHPIRYNL